MATQYEHRITCDRVRRLLAGAAVTQPAAETFPVLGPWDERLLYELPLGTASDVEEARSRARAAQVDWADLPVVERLNPIKRLARHLLSVEEEGLDVIQLETGKSRLDAHEELVDASLVASHTARIAPRLLHSRRVAGALPVLTKTVVSHLPHGVVGIISPWNYPLTLALSDAIPALAAGNAVVLKPAEQTTLTALWCREQLLACGVPADLFQVVPGRGPEVGQALADQVDFLQFTGSTAVGRDLAARAGQRLIPCSMELGGKNAMLVLEDADPQRAAHAAVRACFANSGQLCVSVERIYVHRRVMHAFLERFLREVDSLRLGRGFGWDVEMGSLVSRAQLEKVRAHVDDAVAKGATVLTGGTVPSELGPLFHAPTVLTGVTPGMALYREETFGPVVSVYPVDRDAEAVTAANDSEYGLHAVVMSSSESRARRIAARLHAGTVSINDGYPATWGSTAAPQGGVGASGLGHRHGAEGLLKYTRTQTVAVSHLLPIRVPPGVSNRLWSRTLSTAVKLLIRLGLR